MRAGLGTIHQTLTSEASVVLNQSIAEAARRNHGQATPLHVAATLLSSPSGFLRQACIKSHPNSSHPLQCRALELCFSVALDRLPALQSVAPGFDPPISNALQAALKRAQAQQRRGFPEQQQQQPLLSVKVELEQLVISILDDPSVSRVMKEASFCSPAVKATIEKSLLSTSTITTGNLSVKLCLPNLNSTFEFRSLRSVPVPVPVPVSVPVPGGKNMYVNPKLKNPSSFRLSDSRQDELKKIKDIMSRTKKRNPIVVAESEPELLIKEVLKKANTELNHTMKIVRLEKERLLESWVADIPSSCEVIIDAGDLKWLVEQPSPFVSTSGVATEAGKKVVAVVGEVLRRNVEGSKVWLIGSATCETYLRCQLYFPSLESGWDLQPVSVTGNFSRKLPVKNVDDNVPQWLRKAAPPAIPSPTRPVRTDLVLGFPNVASKALDSYAVEFVKKIFKAVSWQQDAAESVAATITRCKLGNGKRRRGDIWLLFTGPDVLGKKKMVSAISQVVCGAEPTVVRFGRKPTTELTCRMKTSLDQIVDAIRRNPLSVVLLEDIDEADTLVRSSIKRAIQKGWLSDSSGREFSLGDVIFILTANWLPDGFPITDGVSLNEKRLTRLRSGKWNLRVSLSEKNTKRHARWLLADRPIKQKKKINLNEAADDYNSDIAEDDSKDEPTVIINKVLSSSTYSFSRELVSQVDDSVVFKPLDCMVLRRDVAAFIANKFASIMGDGIAVEIDDDALEIIVCGVWLGWLELDEWYDTALLRVIRRLKMSFPSDADSDPVSLPIRLELDDESSTWRRTYALRSVGVCAVGF